MVTRLKDLDRGDRWARLTVLGFGAAERVRELQPGIRERETLGYVELGCDCGGALRIWVDEWRGKKRYKDCGCGMSFHDNACVIVPVSMPSNMREKIKAYQVSHGLNFSQAVRDLCDAALRM